ncbi:MAG: toll/interleukin-1 receptor domain-containing protein [Caulobacteraceae bacterium]|nr:toll/interleukin-1 receptor domain-containing protein [Caulobacteraceae bacterium]
MTDVFVSYAHEDAAVADALAVALAADGWSVWIDRTGLAEGTQFDEEIEAAIGQATVVIVLWSEASVKSRWVRAEAAFALDRGKLVPVVIDQALPPLQFLHVHNVELGGWDGRADDARFQVLQRALRRRLTTDPGAASPPPLAPGAGDESVLRTGLSGMDRALVSMGLRFPGAGQEDQFLERLSEGVYRATQGGLLLAIAVMAVYSATDSMAGVSNALITRVRFMLLIPILIAAFLMSRTNLSRRRWRIAVPAYLATAVGVGLVMIYFIATKSAFGVNLAVPTMNIMVMFGIVALIPVPARTTFCLSLPILALYVVYLGLFARLSFETDAAYAINVVVAFFLCVTASYLRERELRRTFVADLALSDNVATLREAVLRLGSDKGANDGAERSRRELRRSS